MTAIRLLVALALVASAAPLAAATHFQQPCNSIWAENPPGWYLVCTVADIVTHRPWLSPCSIPAVEVKEHRIDVNDYIVCI